MQHCCCAIIVYPKSHICGEHNDIRKTTYGINTCFSLIQINIYQIMSNKAYKTKNIYKYISRNIKILENVTKRIRTKIGDTSLGRVKLNKPKKYAAFFFFLYCVCFECYVMLCYSGKSLLLKRVGTNVKLL